MASDASLYHDWDDSDGEINISMISKRGVSTQDSPPMPVPAWETHTTVPPTTSQPAFPSASSHLEPSGLVIGGISDKGCIFAPFKLVQEYPCRYVSGPSQERVVKFFNETLLRDHVWDFFSQSYPTDSRDPLLLVPTIQFEQFLSAANSYLDKTLAIPQGTAGATFSLTFGEWDTPRPRFLGRADNTTPVSVLRARALTFPTVCLNHLTPAYRRLYHDKMDKIHGLPNPAKSKKAEAARKKRLRRRKDSGRMLKRVQRYLGLRQTITYIPSKLKGPVVTDWDVSKLAPFRTRESVRFICVDVEAWEIDTRIVTEIGLAILDTEDLMGKCPGERGENWYSLVQAYHFRIKERYHFVNYEFVKGCPEAFNFGKSEAVSIKEIGEVVGEIIGGEESDDQRPVIIVGHDIGQDLKYLMSIGYNPWQIGRIMDEIDTQDMLRRMERNPDGRGLAMMCAELGIPGRNYHNAGNDAVYTLRAMITMAIKRTIEGSDTKEDSFTPGSDEWTDGEMDDGGCPQRSAPPTQHNGASQSKGGPRDVQW